MAISRFIPDDRTEEYALAVVNRGAPRPLQSILEDLFTDQPVDVTERSLPDSEDDVVVLLEAGDAVASSPLEALQDCILMVNSDLYITGSRGIDELELPDVIRHLDDVPFSLRGYPESNKEKLLLITISRYIERLAWEDGSGRLRASFQRLSRIDDERGTREVYERLGGSDVDTHVYGVPDWTPPEEWGVTAHGGYSRDYRQAWFLVHVPGTDSGEPAALVAYETAPNEWDGFWTFRSGLVEEVDAYIEQTM